MRLDLYLVQNKIVNTRNKAQEMIKQGLVIVNNKTISKPNFNINNNDIVKIVSELEFVSRAGNKLKHALNEFKIDVFNKICLDIGASTGGFTDCLLQNNAKLVYALDCGTNQLDEKLLNDSRVINLENINLKQIPNLELTKIDIIVCDVSFISLKHVFEAIKPILHKDMNLIFLIKPQFELNKTIILKDNYCIKKESDRQKAINNVISYAEQYNLILKQITKSPIKGAKLENIEYLAWFSF